MFNYSALMNEINGFMIYDNQVLSLGLLPFWAMSILHDGFLAISADILPIMLRSCVHLASMIDDAKSF